MAGMDLGKQYGPLPLGAWVAVVAGGLGIALWTKNNHAADEPVITDDVSGDAGVGTGGSGMWTDLDVPTTGSGGATYASNEAWGTAAINWLIAQGYSPGLSNSAVTKALAGGVDIEGNKMSIQEWSLWTLVLLNMGSPPYPVNVAPPTDAPGPVTQPPDDTTPTPPTTKPPDNKVPEHYTVVAKHGDTIGSIAGKYGKGWKETYDFNVKYRTTASAAIFKARGPNLIFAGTTIWVPK